MSPMPTLTPFGAELYYQRTAPLAAQDAAHDFAWAVLCAALATMFDPYEFVRDDEFGPGYSALMDLDRAPAGALGWLAMFAGVRTIDGLSDPVQRARIDATDGFNRGTPAAIVAAARTYLTGSKRVSLVERDGGDAYAIRVITYATETPNPSAVTAAVLAAKPAGLLLTMQVVVGWLISEMEAFYASPAKTIAAGPETDFATISAYESRI